jgi:hypothetical protein
MGQECTEVAACKASKVRKRFESTLKSFSYFTSRGVRFEIETGITVVYGPNDKSLLKELDEAIEDRRFIGRSKVTHEGECQVRSVTKDGEAKTFCLLCRFPNGICVFCKDAGLPRGYLDCPLCRLLSKRIMAEKSA